MYDASLILFNYAIGYTVDFTYARSADKGNLNITDSMNADDIVIYWENGDTMQVAFNNIERYAMAVDLRNMSKTKVMSTRLRPGIQ